MNPLFLKNGEYYTKLLASLEDRMWYYDIYLGMKQFS